MNKEENIKNIFQEINTQNTKIIEILDDNYDRGYISFLGEILLGEENNPCLNDSGQENKSINKTNKANFVLKMWKQGFSNSKDLSFWNKNLLSLIINESLTEHHHNDIYYKYSSNIKELSQTNIELIYPVSKIDKYRRAEKRVVTETPEFYEKVIKPYIAKQNKENTKFIDNILHDNTEKVYFQVENKFVICKDYKYANNFYAMYFLGIVYDDSIKSLRDINSSHLDLLKMLFDARKELEKIANDMNKEKNYQSRIQAFVHYYPSFFHFHVHYVDVNLDIDSNLLGRAIDLNSIIQNVTMTSDYYQRVSLELTLKIGSEVEKLY